MGRTTWVPWLWAATIAGFAGAAAALSLLAGEHADPWLETVIALLAVGVSLALGLLIAVRRPGNRLAVPLFANAAVITAFGFATAYAQYGLLENPGGLPGAEWAVAFESAAWPLLFAPVVAIALIFPDGRLPGERWRFVAVGIAATFVAATVAEALDGEPFDPPYALIDSPLPDVAAVAWLWPPVAIGGVASLLAAALAVRTRFRRAAGVERLQLKWLVFAAALIPVTLLVCLGFAVAGEPIDDGGAFVALLAAMLIGVPAAVGVAVLRYRLYDIDLLISRTVSYGVLTLLLAAAYGTATLTLGAALGSGSSLVTAGATLLAAAAFLPLRARVQDLVDRRFNRARYDGLRRIAAFFGELRTGAVAPEELEPLLRDVLDDPALELRYWLPASEVYVDARGQVATADPGEDRVRTEIARAGAPLGVVLHSARDEREPRLLADVVEAAGLAIEMVRLQVELRRQLEEVENSRARILAAGYAERRRLERDLHDGAQQRLVSVGLALRHVEHDLGESANGSAELLDQAVTEIGEAIRELRELANGVRPAELEGGLAPALKALAGRAPMPVEVEVGNDRLPPDLEAAAYFIASEGLTNVVKHARASRVRLRAVRSADRLQISVCDNGVGGAVPTGSGLRGLADRVDAHGGSLRMESPRGGGTTLTAELPCES